MEYTTRIVRSSEGLTKEAALLGLQEHPSFMPGTKIANIYNQGGRWVAKLMEPKVAETDVEPCEHCEDKGCQHCKKTAAGAFEDIDESPAEMHDEMHENLESPLDELEENEEAEEHEEKHEQSEEKKLKDLEKKLDLLLDALGISEKGDEPEVPKNLNDEGPADLPAAPAPKENPSKSNNVPTGSGAKLKPGEVPNKPGMTPVGSPAFASVKTATPSTPEGAMPTSSPAPASGASMPSGNAAGANAGCPKCGQTSCTGQCAVSPAGAPMGTSPAGTPSVASFTASKFDTGNTLTIRQAKAQLENHYEGFRVARIKRDGDAIHARMEKRADFLADSSSSFSKEADMFGPSSEERAKEHTDRFRRKLNDHLHNTGQQFGESYKHDPSLDYGEILGRGPEYGVGGQYNSPITVTRGYRDSLAGDETRRLMDDFYNNWKNEQYDSMIPGRRDVKRDGLTDRDYEAIMDEEHQRAMSGEGPWAAGFNRGHFNQYGESPDKIGNLWEKNPEIKQRYPGYEQTPQQQQPAAQPNQIAPQWQPDPNEIF